MGTSIPTQVQVYRALRRERARRAAHLHDSPEQRAAWKAGRVAELRAHATARSTFYRDLHAGLEGAPLEALPVVTKQALLAGYDDVVTDPAVRLADLEAFVRHQRLGDRFQDRWWVAGTGGTTGRPALFPFDLGEWVALMASAGKARSLAGPPTKAHRGRTRFAKVASSLPTHMSLQAGAAWRNPLAPVLRLGATAPVDELVARLQKWQPHGLTAFPSTLRALADEQVAGRLHIAPTKVYASAEPLTEDTRRRVRAAWGADPFDTYVSTEGGTLAAECLHHHGLHVVDDNMVFEVVDAEHRPVVPGEAGAAVLLTVLSSRTIPLIRYEVTDAVRLATDPCPCGRPGPRITSIDGRIEEVLHYPSSDATRPGPVAVPPLLFAEVLDTAAVGVFQVVGEVDRVRILVVAPAPAFSADVSTATVVQALGRLGVEVPVGVEVVAAIAPGPNGKVPLVSAAPQRRVG